MDYFLSMEGAGDLPPRLGFTTAKMMSARMWKTDEKHQDVVAVVSL